MVIRDIEFLLSQISGGVDCEIVREGGENDDCAEQDSSEKG